MWAQIAQLCQAWRHRPLRPQRMGGRNTCISRTSTRPVRTAQETLSQNNSRNTLASDYKLPVFVNVHILHNLNLYSHWCPRSTSLTWSQSVITHVPCPYWNCYLVSQWSSLCLPMGLPLRLPYAGLFIVELFPHTWFCIQRSMLIASTIFNHFSYLFLIFLVFDALLHDSNVGMNG